MLVVKSSSMSSRRLLGSSTWFHHMIMTTIFSHGYPPFPLLFHQTALCLYCYIPMKVVASLGGPVSSPEPKDSGLQWYILSWGHSCSPTQPEFRGSTLLLGNNAISPWMLVSYGYISSTQLTFYNSLLSLGSETSLWRMVQKIIRVMNKGI